jgi:threonyl-tRNA synthetase
MAAAIMELWPEAKLTLGPAIEDGFYYDIDFGDVKISDVDFQKLRRKMHEIANPGNLSTKMFYKRRSFKRVCRKRI